MIWQFMRISVTNLKKICRPHRYSEKLNEQENNWKTFAKNCNSLENINRLCFKAIVCKYVHNNGGSLKVVEEYTYHN